MANVCVIGMWHLGCVTAACLAKNHRVTGYDEDAKVIEELLHGNPPILEPGLKEGISERMKDGSLSFTDDLGAAAAACDVICLAIDTPVDGNDESDLSPIKRAIGIFTPCLRDGQMVVVSSQVPLGTCRKLLGKIEKTGRKVGVCYAPENLRLGEALGRFMKQDRLILGVSDEGAKPLAEKLFEGVEGQRIWMDLESAEMSKHAMNAYLATMISFSGEISDICEKTGADANIVMAALKKDGRVSQNAPIMPGLGFGGGTLARDVQSLRRIGKEKGVETLLMDATLDANRARMDYVEKRLRQALGPLEGKKIAFFGLTYKPGTDTLRRSLALDVIGKLFSACAEIRAYDPVIKKQVETHPQLRVCGSAAEAADGADALVITTAWDEFRSLDYGKICAVMKKPVIVDARNVIGRANLPKQAEYYGVGVTDAKKH